MKQIKTLRELKQAAIDKKAIVYHDRPVPAAVAMNFTGEVILHLINRGLFIYEKKQQKDKEKL